MTDASPPPAARIVWLGLVVAVAAYFVVLLVVAAREGSPVIDTRILGRVLLGIATMQALAIVVLRRRWLVPVPADGAAIPYVLCWALAEAIAVYGLVLGVLAHDVSPARPFFVASVGLLLWLRPRAEPRS